MFGCVFNIYMLYLQIRGGSYINKNILFFFKEGEKRNENQKHYKKFNKNSFCNHNLPCYGASRPGHQPSDN